MCDVCNYTVSNITNGNLILTDIQSCYLCKRTFGYLHYFHGKVSNDLI